MSSGIPSVDKYIQAINLVTKEINRKLAFMESNIDVAGSNADIFLNSVWNTSNVAGMLSYLKSNSNVLTVLPTS